MESCAEDLKSSRYRQWYLTSAIEDVTSTNFGANHILDAFCRIAIQKRACKNKTATTEVYKQIFFCLFDCGLASTSGVLVQLLVHCISTYYSWSLSWSPYVVLIFLQSFAHCLLKITWLRLFHPDQTEALIVCNTPFHIFDCASMAICRHSAITICHATNSY